MNTVIQRCVEELAKDEPRLDYIRGMLDTLLSMNSPVNPSTQKEVTKKLNEVFAESVFDEAAILDAKARNNLDKVKSMSIQ